MTPIFCGGMKIIDIPMERRETKIRGKGFFVVETLMAIYYNGTLWLIYQMINRN